MTMNAARAKKLKLRKKKLKEKSEGGSMIFIKANETIRVRPLPVDEEEEFGLEIIHFYLGAEIKGVVSPKTFNMPCALYERYQELKNSKDNDDKELAATMKPKSKFVVPVVKYSDLKGKKVDERTGVKLIQLANTPYQQMVDYSLDPEQGDFTDPLKGYDIKITRTGSTQFDTEYSCIPCRPTPLLKKYNKVYDIKELLQKELPSYEETKDILKRFMGDDDERPKKKKKLKSGTALKKKKKSSDL